MAEKQAPQKQSFKKSVKHAASEIEPREKSIPQKPLKQQMYTGPGYKKDVVDIKKDKSGAEKDKSVLKDILSISGQAGLFKYISQARNGIIVESLETGKRIQAFSTMKVNSLKDIAVFTSQDEILLEEVFKKISDKESGGTSINHKSAPEELKSYFLKILPDYDQERVYISDIKKMINWYNILQKHDLLKFEKEKTGTETKTKAKTKDKTETEPETEAKTKEKAESKARTMIKDKTEAERDAEAKTKVKTETKAGAKADTAVKPAASRKSKPGPKS
jgi:hypothetical protein